MREWWHWQTRQIQVLVSTPDVRVQVPPRAPTKNALLSTKTKVRFLNDVCLRQMMLASPMMTATPNDVWLCHILWQTSHHCETKWSNIIFAQQMHHVAIGDASLKCPEFYDIITFKEGDFVKENKLAELSMEFAVDIINLVRQLKENREAIISNQIGRSGTSIGANIHEAQYAQGKKDFISKLEIALKEASETGYWLELLHRTNYIDEQLYKSLSAKCTSLRVMLIASCRTAKENAK